MADLNRRRFLTGLAAVACAPAIIRTPGLLMPIKPVFYANRTVRYYMDIQAIRDKNVLLSSTDYAGRPIEQFRGIPIILHKSGIVLPA